MSSSDPTVTTAAGHGLIINVTYDASAASAPAGLTTAVNAAVAYLESVITTPVTVNIDLGWGEVGGQALQANALGESSTALTGQFSYSQIKAALTAQGNTAALASLPASDPTNGQGFEIPTAEAKALGLIPAGSAVDGMVALSSGAAFAFDPTNRAVAGEYDAVGVLEHEITEVMGRISSIGAVPDFGDSVMDLYRYAAPGVRQLSTAGPAYFSLDGGTTNLDSFNTDPSGDTGDWASSAGADSFLAFTAPGRADLVTPTDLAVMNAIGWATTGSTAAPNAATITGVVESPATGTLHPGDAETLTIDFSKAVSVTGTPTLTLSDGATATYQGGSGTTGLSFSYTVAASDQNTASLAVNAVNLNGALIRDTSGVAANLSLASVNQAGPQIDTTAAQLSAAFANVLRLAPTDPGATATSIALADGSSVPNPMNQDAQALTGLVSQVQSGQISLTQAFNTVEHYGDATTSVATLAYEFFTGATPSAAGYDYLISSAANPDNLNSAYYAKFSEVNRYINFAVDLGKYGAGAQAFQAAYGSLSLADAMTKAYGAIFGTTAIGDLTSILLAAQVGPNETRADYFAAYGLDGPDGVGTKAAAVGWLLAEAVSENLGPYAQANDHLLAAMAGGTQQYNVDLVATYTGAGQPDTTAGLQLM